MKIYVINILFNKLFIFRYIIAFIFYFKVFKYITT